MSLQSSRACEPAVRHSKVDEPAIQQTGVSSPAIHLLLMEGHCLLSVAMTSPIWRCLLATSGESVEMPFVVLSNKSLF